MSYCPDTLCKNQGVFYLKGKVISLSNKLLVKRCEGSLCPSAQSGDRSASCLWSLGGELTMAWQAGVAAWPGGGPGPQACTLPREGYLVCPADAPEQWCLQKSALSSPGSFPRAHQFSVASVA